MINFLKKIFNIKNKHTEYLLYKLAESNSENARLKSELIEKGSELTKLRASARNTRLNFEGAWGALEHALHYHKGDAPRLEYYIKCAFRYLKYGLNDILTIPNPYKEAYIVHLVDMLSSRYGKIYKG